MHNSVGVALILEDLIRSFSRDPPDPGSSIEDLLPSGIVRDLVNNENVLHAERVKDDASKRPTPRLRKPVG